MNCDSWMTRGPAFLGGATGAFSGTETSSHQWREQNTSAIDEFVGFWYNGIQYFDTVIRHWYCHWIQFIGGFYMNTLWIVLELAVESIQNSHECLKHNKDQQGIYIEMETDRHTFPGCHRCFATSFSGVQLLNLFLGLVSPKSLKKSCKNSSSHQGCPFEVTSFWCANSANLEKIMRSLHDWNSVVDCEKIFQKWWFPQM